MRFSKALTVCVVCLMIAGVAAGSVEARLGRRLPTVRRQAGQQSATASTAQAQNHKLVTAKMVQLSPMIEPAIGPSGAQGVGSIFYNDVDTSLNSGNLVVTGLPAGRYMAWLVFYDPFTQNKQKIHSELVAEFSVFVNANRTETALTIGLPNVINLSHAKQLVVTKWVRTKAEVGRKPVCGAAGYSGGPAKKQAVLAANIH